MNQHARYLGQRSFRAKAIFRIHGNAEIAGLDNAGLNIKIRQ